MMSIENEMYDNIYRKIPEAKLWDKVTDKLYCNIYYKIRGKLLFEIDDEIQGKIQDVIWNL